MNIIFLDVDGVLNNKNTKTFVPEYNYVFVDDYLVARLRRLALMSNARVVLSSSWRDGWHQKDPINNAIYFRMLEERLQDFNIYLYDKTPDFFVHKGRAIHSWLNAHENQVDNYVILDDEPSLGYDDLDAHLVITQMEDGLTLDNVDKALEILGR